MLSCLALFIGRQNLATCMRPGLVRVVRVPLLFPAKACSESQRPSSCGVGIVDDRGPPAASCASFARYGSGGQPWA